MKALRLLLAVTCIAAMQVPASSQEIIAQNDFVSDLGVWAQPFYPNYVIAQTFVATSTATVTSIDVTINKYMPTDVPISFEIRSLWNSGINGWQPDFSVPALATGTLSADDPLLNDWFINWVSVTMTPCELQSGQSYAIVATAHGSYTSDAGYLWYACGSGSVYPDGNLLVGYAGDTILANQIYDLPFRVVSGVTPPTPTEMVQSLEEDVEALVTGGAVLPANGQSLRAKLDTAIACLEAGDTLGAMDALTAFCNQVRAFVKTDRLTQEQADALLAEAQAIIDSLVG